MKIGIIGAGIMGTGIAQVFAQHDGFDVLLCSSSVESAEKGKRKLEERLQRRIVSGKLKVDYVNGLLARIRTGSKEECADCDMIIESIKEDMDQKRKLFKEMQDICSEDCIFATNTSSLSVTELSHDLVQPVVGMHFFNPAPTMRLIEVAVGEHTTEETVRMVSDISYLIGKIPIRVKESSGFVVNRILIPMLNEAIGLYAEGIANARDIDTAMKLGANHPMGPLELGDYIGWDICLAILENIYKRTGNAKYCPHSYLKKMVRDGRTGIKAGKGIYEYGD